MSPTMAPERSGERTNHFIEDVHEAQRLIVDDALERLQAHDWASLGVSAERISQLYGVLYPSILRNAPVFLGLNVLAVKRVEEMAILTSLSPQQKKPLIDGEEELDLWLIMTQARLDPDLATSTRDWLWAKMFDAIIGAEQLDPKIVAEHFLNDFHARGLFMRMAEYYLEGRF
jgi:hypothetical protein